MHGCMAFKQNLLIILKKDISALCFIPYHWNFVHSMAINNTKELFGIFLISCLFPEIFRYFWFSIVSFIKTFKVICKCNDIGNAHMQSIQIKWKNCLVDFKYLENSPNYESEDSSTLRWLLCFFKIACISFPKVFPSL